MIYLDCRKHDKIDLNRIHEILTQHPGDLPVIFEFAYNGGSKVRLEAGDEFRISQSKNLVQALSVWGLG